MPLLLASTFQHFKKLSDFSEILGTWCVACVITAAIPDTEQNGSRPEWAQAEIDAVAQHAKEFFEYDLANKTPDMLEADLPDCDLIYFIGGNTFHLLDMVNKSGFREFVTGHLAQGKSVWGGSAGAIIHGPDIAFIKSMDAPEKANLTSTQGLELTQLRILPHWHGNHHQEALDCLAKNPDVDIICLTDDQALFIEGNKTEILG